MKHLFLCLLLTLILFSVSKAEEQQAPIEAIVNLIESHPFVVNAYLSNQSQYTAIVYIVDRRHYSELNDMAPAIANEMNRKLYTTVCDAFVPENRNKWMVVLWLHDDIGNSQYEPGQHPDDSLAIPCSVYDQAMKVFDSVTAKYSEQE